MKFYSKVDRWIAVILIVTAIAVLFAAIELILTGIVLPGLLVLLSVALITFSVFPTYYEFAPEQLIIHSGWLRWSIRYSNIIDLKPSDDLRSSPALSTDRIEISYYTKRSRIRTVLISPQYIDRFVHEIGLRRGGLG